MKRFYFFLITLSFSVTGLSANWQNPTLDSLKKAYKADNTKAAKTDTLAINRLNKIAELYFESNPDSTTYYAKLAVDKARKINYQRGIADGYIQIGTANTFRNNFTKAYTDFTQALKSYKKVNDDLGVSEVYMGFGRLRDQAGDYDNALKWFNRALRIRKALYEDVSVAETYALMGITYDNKGEFSKALDCYFQSLKNNLQYNDQLSAADKYNNIGIVMQHLKLNNKALEYFLRALKIWQPLNDTQGISTAYQNIGEIHLANKNYSKALSYFKKALNMFKQLGDKEGIDLIYYDIGLYHYYTHSPDSAFHYMHLSLTSSKQNNINHNKAIAYNGLAMLYNHKRNYKKAYEYALSAKNIAESIGSRDLLAEAVLQISNSLNGLKQFEKALLQHQLYVALTDSLHNNESMQKLASYNMALDFENNQKKAILLHRQKEAALKQKITQQRQTNIIYIVVIVIVSLLLFFYYNAKRKQTQINALLAEKNRLVNLQKADLKEQADNLNNLNVLKDRLIAVLAHDLRAPISTLRNMFSLMGDNDLTPDEFMQMVPRVNEKLQNTSGFLDTLLFWINSQVDNSGAKAQIFPLLDVVTPVLYFLKDQLQTKSITVINNVTETDTAFADPNCIRIAIQNLITNAIKFSNKGGTIELSVLNDVNGSIIFSIKDNGVGIMPEKLNSLFKGTVISNPGTMNEMGTGMGLIFCKDLIEIYGGKIWVESELNQGTVFSFSLPTISFTKA